MSWKVLGYFYRFQETKTIFSVISQETYVTNCFWESKFSPFFAYVQFARLSKAHRQDSDAWRIRA